MATFSIEFETERGAHREKFSIDLDRPIGRQVRRVLEDLRGRGIVLRGGHRDRLEIRWSGVPLDPELTPEQLRLDPARPIELLMRHEEVASVPVEISLERGAPVRWFLPLVVRQSAVLGALGALVAWMCASLFDDLARFGAAPRGLDAMAAGLLGAWTLAAMEIRRLRPMSWRGPFWTLAMAAAGGLLGLLFTNAAYVVSGERSVLIGRLLLLPGLAGLCALLGCLRGEGVRVAGVVGGVALAGLGGLLAALLTQLPGPSDAWLLLAWLLTGTAIAVGAATSVLLSSSAVLEEELRAPSLLHLPWMLSVAVSDADTASIATLDGAVAATARFGDDGALQLRAVEEALTRDSGDSVASMRVVNGHSFWVGDALLRLRVLPWVRVQ